LTEQHEANRSSTEDPQASRTHRRRPGRRRIADVLRARNPV